MKKTGLNRLYQFVKGLSPLLVVLEQPKTGAGGAHDDDAALADGEAIPEGLFQGGEDGGFDAVPVFARRIKPGLRKGF